MTDTKWKWKNGRLHHPTEGFSIGIEEAYLMQQNNDDIADACEGVLDVWEPQRETACKRIIGELQDERE